MPNKSPSLPSGHNIYQVTERNLGQQASSACHPPPAGCRMPAGTLPLPPAHQDMLVVFTYFSLFLSEELFQAFLTVSGDNRTGTSQLFMCYDFLCVHTGIRPSCLAHKPLCTLGRTLLQLGSEALEHSGYKIKACGGNFSTQCLPRCASCHFQGCWLH